LWVTATTIRTLVPRAAIRRECTIIDLISTCIQANIRDAGCGGLFRRRCWTRRRRETRTYRRFIDLVVPTVYAAAGKKMWSCQSAVCAPARVRLSADGIAGFVCIDIVTIDTSRAVQYVSRASSASILGRLRWIRWRRVARAVVFPGFSMSLLYFLIAESLCHESRSITKADQIQTKLQLPH
jgi:hypothetical protein